MSGLHHGRRGRRTLAALAAASLLTGGMAAATPAIAAPNPKPPKAVKAGKHDKLGAKDRELLAKAQAKGEHKVTVMFVTGKGEFAKARNEVKALGGSIRYAAGKLGYFSAYMPVSRVEKAAALDSIDAADLDEVIPLPDVEPKGKGAAVAVTGPGRSTWMDSVSEMRRSTAALSSTGAAN